MQAKYKELNQASTTPTSSNDKTILRKVIKRVYTTKKLDKADTTRTQAKPVRIEKVETQKIRVTGPAIYISGTAFQSMNDNPARFVAQYFEERNTKPLDTWGWRRLQVQLGRSDFNINGLIRIRTTDLDRALAVSGDSGVLQTRYHGPTPECGMSIGWSARRKSPRRSAYERHCLCGGLWACAVGKKQIGCRRIAAAGSRLQRTWALESVCRTWDEETVLTGHYRDSTITHKKIQRFEAMWFFKATTKPEEEVKHIPVEY